MIGKRLKPGRPFTCPCIVQMRAQCGTHCWHHGKGGVCKLCNNTGYRCFTDLNEGVPND